MEENESLEQAMSSVYWRLENSLRGDAFLTKDNKCLTPKEKQVRMQAIEEFVKYLRNYKENIKKLTEYENMINRLIDDGR